MLIARVIARLEPGGAQLGALRLIKALGERGIASRVLAGEATLHGVHLFRQAAVEVDVWGRGAGLQYECSQGFATWLRPRLTGADLVHAHMFGGWWAASEAIADDVPLVASEHNEMCWPSTPQEREMAGALRRVDAFFGHGPATGAEAVRLGLPPSRLRDGRSAIEPPIAVPHPKLPSPRLVFAGRLHREKGPDLLIEALGLMRRPPPTFVLGAGALAGELRRRVDELGLRSVVHFAGWQSPIGPWLAGASVCAVPSRREAWSQTAVTAMAYSVPVVGSAVEGLPLTLAERRGVLVAPDDPEGLAHAIGRVLEGRTLTDLAGARRYAARFTAGRIGAHYADIYARLGSRRRTADGVGCRRLPETGDAQPDAQLALAAASRECGGFRHVWTRAS
jgi:glycosyltransferase involved in cell wall biosynthesis